MKKITFSILAFLLIFSSLAAQDDPGKAMKAAKSSFNKAKVETDETAKEERLQEAVSAIETAIAGIDQISEKDRAKLWLQAGDIYSEQVNADINMTYIDPSHEIKHPEAAMKAYNAYQKALAAATKKYETKDALNGLQASSTALSTIGNVYLNAKEYDKAYGPLNTILELRETLKANEIDEVLAEQEKLNDHLYVVAFCALVSEKSDRAKELFKTLIDADYQEPRIYAQMFNLTMEEDEEAALAYLSAGREKYPDDTEILFAEINYLIQKKEFDKLKNKLEVAMEKAPDNPSVPSALGNVYMNLFQEAYAAGNMEKAEEYFAESKKYYEKALDIDPKMFEAVYSLGSLYYNKAVGVSKAMQALGNSREELKKYDEMAEQMKQLFEVALPYFKRAEKMDPNDRNTLIALKEIYAKNDDFATSNEFKKRLQTVEDGGKNESSFFNE